MSWKVGRLGKICRMTNPEYSMCAKIPHFLANGHFWADRAAAWKCKIQAFFIKTKALLHSEYSKCNQASVLLHAQYSDGIKTCVLGRSEYSTHSNTTILLHSEYSNPAKITVLSQSRYSDSDKATVFTQSECPHYINTLAFPFSEYFDWLKAAISTLFSFIHIYKP